MRIAIGCDDAACHLKAEIMEHIKKCHQEIEIEDFGIHEGETTMYPDIAWKVAQAVADHKFDRGILMCGDRDRYVLSAQIRCRESARRSATIRFLHKGPERATTRRSCAWEKESWEQSLPSVL